MLIQRRAFLGSLAALATVPMIRLAAGTVAHRLTILHMNDFHSRHDPVDPSALNCAPGGKPGCYGGSPRLATAIAIERAAAAFAGRDVLLADAGDQFQGSLFYTAWHGEVELAVMHAIGTEVMAVGNHEFDNGPATLGRFVRGARFPVVSANIDASNEPSLAGLLRPHIVVEKAGLNIGIVGLTTLETQVGSSPGPNVRFNPPDEALAREAASARAAGAKLVVALSHLGYGADSALAGTIPGVDVFLGGHSHTLLSDSEPGAAGPAHGVKDGPAGRAVVLQAACFGRYLGRLDLDIAADGTVLSYGGDCRHIGLDLVPHPAVAAIVAGYAAQIDGIRRRPVGRLTAPFGASFCRVRECALGDLMADAALATEHDGDVAIVNSGGLRTGLPGGEVTLGDVLTALPFGDTVATLKLTGADLTDAVRNGLSRAGKGGFPQVAGMRLRWDPVAAPEQRLASLEIRQRDGSFAPVDPSRKYNVVTNSFIRHGGDGYTVLKEHAIDPYDSGPPLDVALSDAIGAGSPLAPATYGRIVPTLNQ